MRILQLIDSLEPGGAERMAINYANALADSIEFSALVTTRKEGALKSQIASGVSYLFLNRKKIIDLTAIFRLRKFVKTNDIQILHAHGTSFFLAVLLKLVIPSLKIIWHDHYGNSEFLAQRKSSVLKISSLFFNGIISVNSKLAEWSSKELYCKNVMYLPNFVLFDTSETRITTLNGYDSKRIVCLANLRSQKNHFMLLDIAEKIKESYPEWTFHLVGKNFEDAYSALLEEEITARSLENSVYLYGSRDDVRWILEQAEIGILTSDSEGLPVALLEYGYFGKPVICTDVGEISSVVTHHKSGFLCPAGDFETFSKLLTTLISDPEMQQQMGSSLKNKIIKQFSKDSVIFDYLNFVKSRT